MSKRERTRDIQFCLAVPHKRGEEDRLAIAQSIIKDAALGNHISRFEGKIFDEPGAPHEWFRQIIDWAIDDGENGATHLVQLQDDVCLAPQFWEILTAMVAARPNSPICLQSVHEAAYAFAQAGATGYTTRDGMIGVGWVMPMVLLIEYHEWLDAHANAVPHVSEDTMMGIWCAVSGHRIWHPLPTIIDHDTDLVSTYGNDGHGRRRSPVRWDTSSRTGEPLTMYDWGREAPHLGLFYPTITPYLAQKICGLSPRQRASLEGDRGLPEMRWVSSLIRAHELGPGGNSGSKRIFVATPRKGEHHPRYTETVTSLAREENINFPSPYEIGAIESTWQDVTVARSRLVREFLERSDCDVLFFLDADVGCSLGAIRGMLKALDTHPFVCTPYPRRDGIDFEALRKQGQTSPEAVLYKYHVLFDENVKEGMGLDKVSCIPVRRAAMGCSMMTREFLQSMTEMHWDALASWDAHSKAWLCRLFDFFTTSGEGPPPYASGAAIPMRPRLRLGEDFSFCERARESGFQPMIYLGPGSPADHSGDWTFRGDRRAFVVDK